MFGTEYGAEKHSIYDEADKAPLPICDEAQEANLCDEADRAPRLLCNEADEPPPHAHKEVYQESGVTGMVPDDVYQHAEAPEDMYHKS